MCKKKCFMSFKWLRYDTFTLDTLLLYLGVTYADYYRSCKSIAHFLLEPALEYSAQKMVNSFLNKAR